MSFKWLSTVVVLGITSYFINVGPRGLTLTYVEIIVSLSKPHQQNQCLPMEQAVVSVVIFLPAFVSPFMPTSVEEFVLFINMIFSYLLVLPWTQSVVHQLLVTLDGLRPSYSLQLTTIKPTAMPMRRLGSHARRNGPTKLLSF